MTVEIKEISKRSVIETAEDDLPQNMRSSGVTSEIDYLKRLKLRSQIMANHAASSSLHDDELAIAGFKSAEDMRIEKYYGKLIVLYNKSVDETTGHEADKLNAKMELAYLY
jgi:hypothetical protein